MLKGNALHTFSEAGYGYAVEKAGDTRGWTFTVYEEAWNYGIPQEMSHFLDCILEGAEPVETGDDARVALEIVYAAYESAGTGRRVTFPLELTAEQRAAPPYRLWRPVRAS